MSVDIAERIKEGLEAVIVGGDGEVTLHEDVELRLKTRAARLLLRPRAHAAAAQLPRPRRSRRRSPPPTPSSAAADAISPSRHHARAPSSTSPADARRPVPLLAPSAAAPPPRAFLLDHRRTTPPAASAAVLDPRPRPPRPRPPLRGKHFLELSLTSPSTDLFAGRRLAISPANSFFCDFTASALTLEPTGAAPTPSPSQGPSAAKRKPPPETSKITKFLKPGASRGKAVEGDASGGSRSVVLHVGPAVAAVQDKPSGLLGRIVELNRAAVPEATIEALRSQVVKLQGEKEQLIKEHHEALDAQKTALRELKEQAMQAALQHEQALKDARVAAEARLAEVVEDSTNSNTVLTAELEEEKKARKAAERLIDVMTTDHKEYDRLVMQIDALAFRKPLPCPFFRL
nr:uncharacterized protein LOC127315307 [Lolium perenne]